MQKCVSIGILIYLSATLASIGQHAPIADVQHILESGDIDTARIERFTLQYPERISDVTDTVFTPLWLAYDPIYRYNRILPNLGNLASPTLRSYAADVIQTNVDLGLHSFELYKKRTADHPFYLVKRAYTDLIYSQGGEQNDGFFKAKFARNFANNVQLSLDYHRIFQTGDIRQLLGQARMDAQKSRHAAVSLGIWYKGPKQRYECFLSYVNNFIQHKDLGGLVDPNQLIITNPDLFTLDVKLEEAFTREDEHEIAFNHSLSLFGKSDSIKRNDLRIHHNINFLSRIYKFYDEDITDASDSLYYEGLINDTRGMRLYLEHKSLVNDVAAQFTLDTEKTPLLIRAGLKHTYNDLYYEPRDSVITNLALYSRVGFDVGTLLKIKAYGHLLFGDQAGAYHIEGDIALDLGRFGKLNGLVRSKATAPSLLQENLILNQSYIYQKAHDNIVENTISASYRIPYIEVDVKLEQSLFNQYIYFDEMAVSQQSSGTISLSSLHIQKNIEFFNIHLDNRIAFYNSTDDRILPVPTVNLHHSLYYSGYLFKKALHLQAGLDFRYFSSYTPNVYQAANGQFIAQDELTSGDYPFIDPFVHFTIGSFHGYVKMENIYSYFKDEVAYLTPEYPVYDRALRIGIRWRFLD